MYIDKLKIFTYSKILCENRRIKIIDKIIERMNAINRNEFDKNLVELKFFNYLYHKIHVRRYIRNRWSRRIRFRIRNYFSSEFVNCFSRINRNNFDDIQQ